MNEIAQMFGCAVAVVLGITMFIAAFAPLVGDNSAAGVKVSRG